MKYIKTFESKYNKYSESDVDDVKKLLSHLTKIFSYYGIDYSNYYENRKHETEFSTSGVSLFDISVDTVLGKHLTIHIFNNESFYMYLLKYFKTIKGLTPDFETTTKIRFDITGNVDNIIKQITNNDYDSKLGLYIATNKFNL